MHAPLRDGQGRGERDPELVVAHHDRAAARRPAADLGAGDRAFGQVELGRRILEAADEGAMRPVGVEPERRPQQRRVAGQLLVRREPGCRADPVLDEHSPRPGHATASTQVSEQQ